MSAGPSAQVVQLASLSPAFDDALAREFSVVRLLAGAEGDAEALARARTARVAVTTVRRGFSQADIAAFPGLRAVCNWGVGYDTLDAGAARAAGIHISNTPEVLDDCVADLAWALLLAAARKLPSADAYVKAGQWRSLGGFPLTTKVSGKRLGILGLGRIGGAIARRGAGFDMDIRYHSRRPVPGAAYPYEADLAALAGWADFLVVAVPGSPGTRHLVDGDVIEALGPGGILVNIARGSVVDQKALARALESRVLGGAGLDVLETEPFPQNPFAGAGDRVVLTPHIGSATVDTRRAMDDLVLDNVRSFLATGRLRTEIPETL